MKRILLAAGLAVIIHGLLFLAGSGYKSRPAVLRRSPLPIRVAIDLPVGQSGLPKPGSEAASSKPLPPVRKQPVERCLSPGKRKRPLKRPPKPRKAKPAKVMEPGPQAADQPIPDVKPATARPPEPIAVPAQEAGQSPGPAPSARPHMANNNEEASQSRQGGAASGSLAKGSAPPGRNARPLYLLNSPPVYPLLARQRRYEGTVILAVLVDEQGRATKVEIAQASGYRLLDRAALQAVRQWRFEPAVKDGRPVAVRVKVPICFKLQ